MNPSSTTRDPAVPAGDTRFRPAVGLAWLGGFAGFGVGLSALYAVTGHGVGCPFRAVTGWECPFCGGTRLGSALLHGDVVAAFWFNPVVFVALAGLTVVGAAWVGQLLGGPALRAPARLRRVSANQWLLAGAVVATAYTLLRNLL